MALARHQAAGESPTPPNAGVVGFSSDRTLVRRTRGDGPVLCKIYERGSLEQARAEADAGKRLAGAGVVRYGEAFRDPETGRPTVELELLDGEDLRHRILRDGPLPMHEVAEVGIAVARTLQRLAEAGEVHRDLKPGNIVMSGDRGPILVDAEHAVTAGELPEDAEENGFTGATHGYAPPEAYRGAAPQPAFDVFGLGATLWFAATGRSPFFISPTSDPAASRDRSDRGIGLPDGLRNLLEDCVAADPQQRPSAAEVAERLERWLAERDPGESVADRALECLWRSEFDRAAAVLVENDSAPDAKLATARTEEIGRLILRRQRLSERTAARHEATRRALSRACDTATSDDLIRLATELSGHGGRVHAWLRRFPLDDEARTARGRFLDRAYRLLDGIGGAVTTLRREGDYGRADRLCQDTTRVVDHALALAGRLEASRRGAAPSPVRRNPLAILEQLLDGVRVDRSRHEELLDRLRHCEAALDLVGAGRVVDELARLFGGASEAVGRLKDRLHSLVFYLGRLSCLDVDETIVTAHAALASRSAGDDEPDGREGRPEPTSPFSLPERTLRAFVDRCADAVPSDHAADVDRQAIGPRSARRIALEALEAFPWIEPALDDGVDALRTTLETVTRVAWDVLDEAGRRLAAPPIPIRLVRELLEQLDELRLADMLVDLPDDERSRSALLDGVERVRERFEQARSVRNQIARGAQDALQRGHITTALFDMARAVDRFEDAADGDEHRGESERLARQLEEARRHKQEVERRIQANQALALRYAQLRDATDSRFDDRVRSLEERSRALTFLTDSVSGERSASWAHDHREVVDNLLQEHADEGDRRLDALPTDALAERADSAGQTLIRLQEVLREHAAGTGDAAGESGGRAVRLTAHWQTRVDRLQRELAERQQQSARRARRRVAWVLVILTVGAIAAARLLL